jgi:hypothetical protein
MAGKRKTPAQRAIELVAIMADCSLKEVNELLNSAGFPNMNKTSYIMVKKQYVPFIRASGNSYIKEHLYSPRRLNQLRKGT